jgi:hypothetical protein
VVAGVVGPVGDVAGFALVLDPPGAGGPGVDGPVGSELAPGAGGPGVFTKLTVAALTADCVGGPGVGDASKVELGPPGVPAGVGGPGVCRGVTVVAIFTAVSTAQRLNC